MATLEQRIYDGEQAKQVLENPAFAQALADIRQELIEQWKQAPARDLTGKEHLWNLHKLTDKLEVTLRASLDSGRLAAEELKHQRSMADRARAVLGMTY